MKKKRNLIIVSAVILVIAIAAVVFFTNYVISKDVYVFETKTEIGTLTIKMLNVGDDNYYSHFNVKLNGKEIKYPSGEIINHADIDNISGIAMGITEFSDKPTHHEIEKLTGLSLKTREGEFIETDRIEYLKFKFVYDKNISIKISNFDSNPHMYITVAVDDEILTFSGESVKKPSIISRNLFGRLKDLKTSLGS